MQHLEQETLELIQETKAKRIKLIKSLEQAAQKKKPKKQPKPQKKKAS